MAARWYPINSAAHRALTNSTAFNGPRVTITDHLGEDWPSVKTVLEKLGAVYVVGTSAFDFQPDQDAYTLVTQALADGRVMGLATSDGFVSTPADLAEELVHTYGELSPARGRRLRVLEPSAGIGRFVAAIRDRLDAEWCEITAVEPDARRAQQIPTDEATTVHVETFERFAPLHRLNQGWRFDVIIMNPPFSVPGRANIWAEHLFAAWDLLAPGGRLLAIVPASVLDLRRAGLVGQAAQLVYLNGEAEQLPRDAFAESGIFYGTAVVSLDKPLVDAPELTPASAAHSYVFRTYTGDEQPLPVARPMLTRAASVAMPVQVWRDAWRGGRERVLRYRAECAICERPVWGFDDGENEPRGVLGDQSAGYSLDPQEYDREGMPVGLCALCGNYSSAHDRAEAIARRVWDDADCARVAALTASSGPAPTPTPAPVPAWEFEGQLDLWAELADHLGNL